MTRLESGKTVNIPPQASLHGLVFAQADKTPDHPAVRDRTDQLTYRQLAHRAMALATRLSRLGLAPESPVGIYLPRDRHLPAALIGVMAAGGAYVPLDPKHPPERTRQLLDIAHIRHVVTTRALAGALPDTIHPLYLDDTDQQPLPGVSFPGDCRGLAYIIFTSGSTGTPKGVMIEHRNAIALLRWAHREYSAQALSQVASGTSITFDLSVFELFAPLTLGGCVHLLDNSLELSDWPHREAITLVNTVPSVMWELLTLGGPLPSPAVINLAGEPLAQALVNALADRCPEARLYNLYGPSEDTTYSTGGPVRAGERTPTIGRPLDGRHLYLLDEHQRPVAPGEVGEMYVGGPGVARGYLNRPDLDNAFLPGIHGDDSRLYRTGDYGKTDAAGRLLYLGRRDDQVKIRGHRIELNEIDAVIRRHPDVADTALVVIDSASGDRVLRCALELRGGSDHQTIHRWVSDHLPRYMVPSDWLLYDRLPRLPNGKIDRSGIRAERPQRPTRPGSAPQGTWEERLAELWTALLGVEDIVREDDFLALGGHSLLVARLGRDIRRQFAKALTPADLFTNPRLADQARLLEQADPLPADAGPRLDSTRLNHASASPSQQRMWTLERLLPGSPRYNIAAAFEVHGDIDRDRLTRAVQALVTRHPVLRTLYRETADGLQQVLAENPAPEPDHHRIDATDRDTLPARATEFAQRPFHLDRETPLRVGLFSTADNRHLLVVVTHHIAADGSMDRLIEDLVTLYNEPDSLTDTPPDYFDYATWLASEPESHFEAALSYWRTQLKEPPPALNLPTDRSRSPDANGQGRLLVQTLDQDLVTGLNQLSRRGQSSLFQTLLALNWAFFGRLCDTEDVMLTAPLHNRPAEGFEHTVGNFVNTVILRGRFDGTLSVSGLQAQARQRTLEAMQHGHLPYERVLNATTGLRNAQGTPTPNVMVSLLPSTPDPMLTGVTATPVTLDTGTSRFDLGWFFRQSERGLALHLEYDTALFTPATAERLVGHWAAFVRAALARPDAPLATHSLLSPAQHHTQIEQWNDTTTPYDRQTLVHRLFERQARRQPDHIAVTGPGYALTYRQLDQQANRLANRILAAGLGVRSHIGLLCERGPELIVGVLGILKAGCAYVPFDPVGPESRHLDMMRIADIRALVTDRALRSQAEALGDRTATPSLTVPAAEGAVADTPAPDINLDSDALAYIIFTSGTTGEPKAVAVRHRPSVNLIDWVNRTYRVGPGDKGLFVTSIAFDLSVYDILGMLAAGGTIRVARRSEIQDPTALADILRQEGITFWNSAPVALDQCVPYFAEDHSHALRLAFLSGDWVPVTLQPRLRRAFPNIEVIALGGATEAVVWSNHYPIRSVAEGQRSIPYGRPIQNARYYILDRYRQPAPIGVEGDLYIGGEVLADGYYNAPDKTAHSFVADPFSTTPDAVMYRTGDRARFFDDGCIEFLGRRDSQAKINGYRIETGEIEAALLAHPDVASAHVAIKGERHRYWLCAYLVAPDRDDQLTSELRGHLRDRLPEYMMPSAFVRLPALPLTANGKLDRQRLPEPGKTQPGETGTSDNPYEQQVAEIWKRVLRRESLGMTDNFFDAGGNSALLIQTHRAIEALVKRSIPVVTLFRYTTIRALSRWLAGDRESGTEPVPDAATARLEARQRQQQRANRQRRVRQSTLTPQD